MAFRSRARGCTTCLRLTITNCRIRPAALSPALRISCRSWWIGSLVWIRLKRRSLYPLITVSRLLKSCATLPAIRPRLSSFCACRSCTSNLDDTSSRRDRRRESRRMMAIITKLVAATAAVVSSQGTASPGLRKAATGPTSRAVRRRIHAATYARRVSVCASSGKRGRANRRCMLNRSNLKSRPGPGARECATQGARRRSGRFLEASANRENPSVGARQVIYPITFVCYGRHLHGCESGSVDHEHNVPGTPILEVDSARAAAERERMDQAPYHLDQIRRDAVLEAIQEVCARLESAGGPCAQQSRAHGGGGGGSAGAGQARLQDLCQPPSESHEAGGTEPEAMGAPRQHPMAMEATARFGGHTVCRWGAGRCHVRVRVSRTLSSCRQPLSYVRGSESAHFHVHPLSCRAPC